GEDVYPRPPAGSGPGNEFVAPVAVDIPGRHEDPAAEGAGVSNEGVPQGADRPVRLEFKDLYDRPAARAGRRDQFIITVPVEIPGRHPDAAREPAERPVA